MQVLRRIIIVGNAGSGKTYLAGTLADRLALAHIELDSLHWLPGGFSQRRPPEEAAAAVRCAARGERWVIEGVYGWLAAVAAPRAEGLTWLDLPEEACVANLQGRPIKSGEDAASRDALVAWCRAYRERTNANSFAGHRDLFERFPGRRERLCSRDEVSDFLAAGLSP